MSIERLKKQFLYPKEYKEQKLRNNMTEEKLNDNEVIITRNVECLKQYDVKLNAFNIETSIKAEYDGNRLIPLIKLIVDFYKADKDVFEKYYINDKVHIALKLFGNTTILENMKIKKSSVNVPANGIATFRMIFKNR